MSNDIKGFLKIKEYSSYKVFVINVISYFVSQFQYVVYGFGAGAARSRGIWLEPEPSLWPGSGSTLDIC